MMNFLKFWVKYGVFYSIINVFLPLAIYKNYL
jgi:hypothetical protein